MFTSFDIEWWVNEAEYNEENLRKENSILRQRIKELEDEEKKAQNDTADRNRMKMEAGDLNFEKKNSRARGNVKSN